MKKEELLGTDQTTDAAISFQEQNMMLIRERDEYKERSKREVSIVDDT